MMGAVEIRPAGSHSELHACVDLQEKIWGFHPRDAVPFNLLHVIHLWSGQVLVAVDGGQVVGFCFGMAGHQYGQPAFLSHMTAVLPGNRGQGVAARLKLAQARWSLENGYGLITWTYDPLEAVNAYLNLARLGGIVRRYITNHYGEMTDGLNKGLPTDRLLVEWHLRHPRVAAVLAGAAPPPLPPPVRTCSIPGDVKTLKATDPGGALRWRMQVREQLQGALAEGCVITGFRADATGGAYTLTKDEGGGPCA